jgi:VWFA-related protein
MSGGGHTFFAVVDECGLLMLVRRLFYLSLLLLLSPAFAWAQQPQDDDEIIKIPSSLVRLNIGVVDAKGHPILNLTREDFAVFENEQRQAIQSFEPVESPFSVVLLLDVSGSTINFRQQMKLAAGRFIDALAPDDRVCVVQFNAKVKELFGFTTKRNEIANAINNASGGGETHLYQALAFSLEKLSKEGDRRKAIVVMTDGVDTRNYQADGRAASDKATNEAALAAIKPEENSPLRAVLNAADKLGATIYPLALPSGDIKFIPDPTPRQVAIYTSARARLLSLAQRSGGRVNEIRQLSDMARLYAEVAAELRTLYSITYKPENLAKDGTWRPIRITVTRPELIARTRPGYFAK